MPNTKALRCQAQPERPSAPIRAGKQNLMILTSAPRSSPGRTALQRPPSLFALLPDLDQITCWLMLRILNRQCVPVCTSRLRRQVSALREILGADKAAVGVVLVSDQAMVAASWRYLGVARSTDVLSFPSNEAPVAVLLL
jgi:hypothetical protein